MATRKLPDSVAPSVTPHRAIELLRERLADCERIKTLPRGDPAVQKWVNTTEAIVDATFGKPDGQSHQMTIRFTHAGSFPIQRVGFSGRGGTPEHVLQQHHQIRTDQRKAVLESCIEQLELLAPPAAAVAVGQYWFHADIERVSGDLFRDGHYTQTALAAYIRVIEDVKRRSGLNLDGDALMNQAFGCDNRAPVLKFNALSTAAETDEQRGFLFLFKGIVGLRNSKAHSNRLFNDPCRAHEYLALASLLMRLLEMAS